jgi:hypothetical protein
MTTRACARGWEEMRTAARTHTGGGEGAHGYREEAHGFLEGTYRTFFDIGFLIFLIFLITRGLDKTT